MIKRLIAIFLAVATVLGLPSCMSREKKGSTDVGQTEANVILVSELADYRIVYAKGISMEVFKGIRELQDLVQEKFGIRIESSGDDQPEQEKEILIGITNRSAGATVFAKVPKADDYAVGISGKKIVVAAHTQDTVVLALDAFFNALENVDGNSQIFFDENMGSVVTKNYAMDTILLGEYDVADYTIVCDGSEEGLFMADKIQSAIRSKCGYLLRVSSAPVNGNMILVGNTVKGAPAGMSNTSKDYYYVGLEGSDLYLYGEAFPAAYKAVEAFCETVLSAEGNAAVLNVSEGTTAFSEDTSMTAMSFNVLCRQVDTQRMENVVDTIKRYMPDTFGLQEATAEWMTYLNDVLKDQYGCVGEGRDPSGSNEYNAIFYRKDRFDLVASDTKWLSDTPDVVGSKLSGSAYPRIFTYAILKVKSTGEELIHVNTHPDHVEEEVRLKQVQVIEEFLKNNYPDMPTILTGDMNDTADKPSMSYLTDCGFKNSADLALIGDHTPTFKERVIDFVMVSEGDFFIYEYDVDAKLYDGSYASDHRAIITRYQLRK